MTESYDIILVGGGLANGLIAWRLAQRHPRLRLLLLERDPAIGGNHTWSFYATDLLPPARDWIAPLIAHRWPASHVRFPGFTRRLPGTYASLTTASLQAGLGAVPQLTQLCDAEATAIAPDRVTLRDGRSFTAPLVIDGRGYRPSPHLQLRWQKFMGLEVECDHGLAEPVIMDATVAQADGYRFVYLLPYAPGRLLVEDTYYSDGAALDLPMLDARIRAYAAAQGWTITATVRREQGVLPLALDGDIDAFLGDMPVPRSGLGAALFHPVTGYSLPDAVRLAEMIAAAIDSAPELTSAALAPLLARHIRRHWRRTRFLRLLNRMLFLAAAPQARWRVLARFYRLPAQLIARFYAGRLTLADKLRLLAGKPPVPVMEALRACLGTRTKAG